MKRRGDGIQLYVLTDTSVQNNFSHVEIAELAIRGGADIIQLRESKKRETGELIKIAKAMRELCTKEGVMFIVNDRVDIAMISEADGVHVGNDDLPVSVVRKLLGPDKIIGASAGSLEQALQREKEGASYIGYGHIFHTLTKEKETQPKGVDALKKICSAVQIPVVAIGGIDIFNLPEVVEAEPFGIAVIRAVCGAKDPESATRQFKETIQNTQKQISTR